MATAGIAQSIVDKQEWLDAVSEAVQPLVNKAFSETGEAGRLAKDLLTGVWLGHPLHPVITDVPIGAWTISSILDLISMAAGNDDGLDRASDLALGTGILAAFGAAATGITDWSDVGGAHRRMGMAHALLNVAGLGLNLWSLGLRLGAGKGGKRGFARALSFGGYGVSAASAFIAGELIYNLGQAINRNAWTSGPEKYTDVAPVDDLPDGRMAHFEVDDKDIVVVRHEDGIHAFGGTCSHYGCGLWEGELEGHTVTCQCHGSQFDITSGSLIHGPATASIPSYEARVREGRLQVRERKS
jgi:nitrite reductase/ring-hydroxylating ferredoxin subunit